MTLKIWRQQLKTKRDAKRSHGEGESYEEREKVIGREKVTVVWCFGWNGGPSVGIY